MPKFRYSARHGGMVMVEEEKPMLTPGVERAMQAALTRMAESQSELLKVQKQICTILERLANTVCAPVIPKDAPTPNGNCAHCGGSQWDLQLSPTDEEYPMAPRDVLGVRCHECNQPAPSDHPLWPRI